MQPDYLLISTWNEHLSQPQKLTRAPTVSMGFESDKSMGATGFVGADLSPAKIAPSLRLHAALYCSSHVHMANPLVVKWRCVVTDTVRASPADVFGEVFSRDVEPTQYGGTLMYDIMTSCIKVFRLGYTACTPDIAMEPCCAGERSWL